MNLKTQADFSVYLKKLEKKYRCANNNKRSKDLSKLPITNENHWSSKTPDFRSNALEIFTRALFCAVPIRGAAGWPNRSTSSDVIRRHFHSWNKKSCWNVVRGWRTNVAAEDSSRYSPARWGNRVERLGFLKVTINSMFFRSIESRVKPSSFIDGRRCCWCNNPYLFFNFSALYNSEDCFMDDARDVQATELQNNSPCRHALHLFPAGERTRAKNIQIGTRLGSSMPRAKWEDTWIPYHHFEKI